MTLLVLDISKYIIVMLMAVYVASAFLALKRKDGDFRHGLYLWMELLALGFYALSIANVWLHHKSVGNTEVMGKVALLGVIEFLALLFFPILQRLIYRDVYRLLTCQMQMLLGIGFVILARLNPDHAKRQFIIICVSLALFMIVPLIVQKWSFLRKLTVVYGGVGIGGLMLVLISGRLINGSKLNYDLMGLIFQPSEVIKVVFAFFIAALVAESVTHKRLLLSAILAGVHVLILVASRDLGSALIYFVMYIAMVYVASGKQHYLIAGIGGGLLAAVAGYFLFSHVRSRVQVWLDPWADIDNKGYQVTQSLFGIATGSWFGLGLGHGSPKTIPYVEEDFVFSAVAEELGVFFAILLILLCLSVVLAALILARRMKDPFYRIVAVGLGICYGIQVVLTIGGGTGFIPLTGVTLPFISGGGTSVLVTIVLFGVLQGIYMLRMDEFDAEEEVREEREAEWEEYLESEEASELDDEALAEKEEEFFADAEPEEDEELLEHRAKQNRCIAVQAVLYALIYLLMFGNIVRFLILQGGEAMTNSYNGKLLAILEEDNTRGTIYAADGTVLAESIRKDGVEVRSYPFSEEFAQVVGYAAKGGDGIERKMQRYLITSDILLSEKLRNDMQNQKDPGNNVHTTLLPELQKTAYEALGNNRGAVVVTDVKTGRILAMVSKPAYDPNRIEEIWDDVIEDEESGVLLDRASQGLYPPGSTFKICTALEYIRENPETYRDYHFDCSGTFTKEDSTIQCFHGTVHGEEDLFSSFAHSCNSSFANIGVSLDQERFAETLKTLHFNETLKFDLETNPSQIRMGKDLNTNDMMQTCIGQDKTQVSPLLMNLITAAIANDGVMMQPYLIDRVVTADGRVIKRFEPKEYGTVLSNEEAEIMTELMKGVVEYGTGKRINDLPFAVAGKTGSAEFSSNKAQSHAWFTGFAPAEDPQIAVTVIMENAGSGGEKAAPVAGKVMQEYLSAK